MMIALDELLETYHPEGLSTSVWVESVAEWISDELAPSSVLIVGSASSELASALEQRGLSARSINLPDAVLSNPSQQEAAPDVGGVSSAVGVSSYDLVVSVEALGEVDPIFCAYAVDMLCSQTSDVLFAERSLIYGAFAAHSTPYWASLFAHNGFVRDLEFDATGFLPWAARFRKAMMPPDKVLEYYELRFQRLERENRARASLNLDQNGALKLLEGKLVSSQVQVESLRSAIEMWEARWAELERGILWPWVQQLQKLRADLMPPGSKRERWLLRFTGRSGRVWGDQIAIQPVTLRHAFRLHARSVNIVLSVLHGVEVTSACLESFERYTSQPYCLTLVLGKSVDVETQAFVTEWAVSRHIETVSDVDMVVPDTRYTVWLNTGALVTPGWLDHLVACVVRDEGLEAVAPLTNRSLTLAYENASPDEIAALVERASAGMILPTESLSGACVLAKTEFPLTTGARVGVCDATYIHTMGAEERVPAVSVSRAPPEERVWLGAQARLQAAPQRQAFIGRGRAEFEGRRVLFVLPVATPGGGANIVISEGLAMRSMGVDVQLYNLPENRAGFENAYPGMRIPVHYGAPKDLAACAGGYDAVVATFNTSVQWLAPLSGGTAIRAYYVQGFEPYVYESGTLQYQTALESYTLYSDLVRFTKTDWTRREVLGATGGDCWVVGPSFELDLFRPRPVDRSPSSSGPVRIAAMVRPFSIYRAPKLTMGLLRRARRRYGDAVEVYLFGIPIDHPEFANLPNDYAWKLAGILEPKQMARMLAMVDVFVDFSEHQAMGLTAMEAMACGNGVIVPQRGGAISFARHEHNALVVDTSSERDCWHSLQRLIEDQELLALLRTNALRDIVHSYPERAAFNILRVLFASEKGVDL